MMTKPTFASLALISALFLTEAISAQPFVPDYRPIQPNNIRAWFSNEARAFQGN
jgi:hypothetical protein